MSDPKRVFLFLDIDGVLNGTAWMSRPEYKSQLWPMRDIDPECCTNLIEAVKGLPVDIVLSSSWRAFKNVNQWLEFCGFTVIGQTPKSFAGKTQIVRGLEVKAYLIGHSDPYVILDDERDFLPEQIPHLFRTDPRHGLTRKQSKALRAMLEDRTHD